MQSVVVPYEAHVRDNAAYNELDAEVASIMREDQIIEEYLYNNQLPERNHQGKWRIEIWRYLGHRLIVLLFIQRWVRFSASATLFLSALRIFLRGQRSPRQSQCGRGGSREPRGRFRLAVRQPPPTVGVLPVDRLHWDFQPNKDIGMFWVNLISLSGWRKDKFLGIPNTKYDLPKNLHYS